MTIITVDPLFAKIPGTKAVKTAPTLTLLETPDGMFFIRCFFRDKWMTVESHDVKTAAVRAFNSFKK